MIILEIRARVTSQIAPAIRDVTRALHPRKLTFLGPRLAECREDHRSSRDRDDMDYVSDVSGTSHNPGVQYLLPNYSQVPITTRLHLNTNITQSLIRIIRLLCEPEGQ